MHYSDDGMPRSKVDDSTFTRLVEPHVLSMLRTAAIIIGTSNAEDVVQEALLQAWRGWHTLREKQSLHSWLLRITVNACFDWKRKRSSLTENSIASIESLSGEELHAKHYPGSTEHALHLDLQQALETLETDNYLAVALRYYVGESSSEIGQILNISPATVRTRLRRALSRLKVALNIRETKTP